MANEEVFEGHVNGETKRFVIRRITYGAYQKVLSVSTKTELLGNVPKSQVDTGKMMDELMKAAVESKDGADFHNLDLQDGLRLQERVLEFNGLGDKGTFRP